MPNGPHGSVKDAIATRRVFGLGIDEKIQWVVADVAGPTASITNVFEHGTFDIDFAGREHKECDLGHEISSHLDTLNKTRPDLFLGIDGLGVSTIGIVNQAKRTVAGVDSEGPTPVSRTQHVLRSIARKNLLHKHDPNSPSDEPLINFTTLFEPYFPEDTVRGLKVHNDATAKALVEYHLACEARNTNIGSTLLLIFGEGVNGGIIMDAVPLSSSLHPEIGHIRPKPHPKDRLSKSRHKQVCTSHDDCYEAIASGARIRENWGGQKRSPDFNISDLEDDHVAWTAIPYYVAQLCIVGTHVLAPNSIILGGSVITGREGDNDSYKRNVERLLPAIRDEFSALNNGYIFYNSMLDKNNYIQVGRVVENTNVIAALQVASLAAYPEAGSLPPKDHVRIGSKPELVWTNHDLKPLAEGCADKFEAS